MSKMLLEYDPLSGIAVHLDFVQESGAEKMIMTHTQNVNPILDQAIALANDEDYTKRGVKRDEWHYARLPYVVLQEMKSKHKVDWNDKNDKDHKKFFSVLNREYPRFKTTHWNHE